MKKIIIAMLTLAITTHSYAQKTNKQTHSTEKKQENTSIHHFKTTAIDGSTIDFKKFKGKKILIVNTASKCGFTPQYEQLEKLYKQYKNQLVIVAFPSDDFGKQELDTNQEIASFCKVNYGVTFPIATKTTVKGKNINPIFEFLTQKTMNNVKNTEIKWNFTKFLLDEQGKLIDSFPSKTEPYSKEITKHLK